MKTKTPVTIVIPCFNEEPVLSHLAGALTSAEAPLSERYEPRFVFVDDGSRDNTWGALRRLFGSKANCTLLRHERNRGISAAIMTGIHHANTEIVCSMDSDCTYDPSELLQMIPMLGDGIDLVTASPYHPRGSVRHVSAYRLLLSKGASFLYRRVLRQKLFTYTSCFRVYRRSTVVNLPLRESGFLGVAELLALLDFNGSTVAEYPTTLAGRACGQSKMKIVRTIVGHLRLLVRLLGARLSGSNGSRSALETGLVGLASQDGRYVTPTHQTIVRTEDIA
jgi:glycosyltransferase involved in cell wall biosynthesis